MPLAGCETSAMSCNLLRAHFHISEKNESSLDFHISLNGILYEMTLQPFLVLDLPGPNLATLLPCFPTQGKGGKGIPRMTTLEASL